MFHNFVLVSIVRKACPLLMLMLAWPASAASSEPFLEDDPGTRLGIQMQKVKQRSARYEIDEKKMSNGQCGDINIGNSEPAKGSNIIAGREKNIIVLGPVIKADSCR